MVPRPCFGSRMCDEEEREGLSFHRQSLKETSGGYDAGAHLFPFRTEKLSPAVPMILHPCGKVGRRPPIMKKPAESGLFQLGVRSEE